MIQAGKSFFHTGIKRLHYYMLQNYWMMISNGKNVFEDQKIFLQNAQR